MRRFSPLLLVLVLALIVPSAALATARSVATAAAPHAQALTLPSALSAAGRATCTISGTVLNFDGTPMAGAEVDWGYVDAGSSVSGANYTFTDGAGHFALSSVTITAAGLVNVFPANTDNYLQRSGLNFVDGAAFIVQPGQITFTTDHGAGGSPWTSVHVETYGPGGTSRTVLGPTNPTDLSGPVMATSASVDHAVAYWFINEGKELALPAPIAVTPGTTSAGSLTIGEAGAQLIDVQSQWASGAPGSRVNVAVENWTAPMAASFYFASVKPGAAAVGGPAFIGNSSGHRTVTLTIPKTTPPGFAVEIHMAGTDPSSSLLDLYDNSFQVCTLVANKASIAKGASVRLSGVIPANGIAKKVVLYSRTTKATTQPSKWDAAKAGWKKVATLSASKAGAYKSGLLKPTKTTWYVVRYPGDSFNSDAFTSVLKVAVH
jgi:hypothetical protein